MRTLCIDIGGSGVKGIVYDAAGKDLTERKRVATPKSGNPTALFDVVGELGKEGEFDRVSVGFPGVVVDGVSKTAPNLAGKWKDVPIADEVSKRLGGKPVRVANDADIQGLAVIEGKGLEMMITLGTGMGSALYIDGKSVPNLELGHHPFMKGATYEQRVSDAARKEIGNDKWNKRVRQVIDTLAPIFNYRTLFIGGGNTRKLERIGLPENVVVVENIAGLYGGLRLWDS